MGTVNIAGVDKGALLAALFNGSAAAGMGIFQANRGPSAMTDEYGQQIIDETLAGQFGHDGVMLIGVESAEKMGLTKPKSLYFDYLYGRPLKVDLTGDEVDSWGYDRDNGGEGTLAAIVKKLQARQ